MKKIMIFVFTLAIAYSMNISAFAAEEAPAGTTPSLQEAAENSLTDDQNKPKERRAAFEQKKTEVTAFREAVKEHRDIVKENRDKNKALIRENSGLRKDLAEKLKELKDSGVRLDADAAAELEALKTEMKAINAELRATKGDIKEITDEKRESIRALDYESMNAVFVRIGEIQAARNADLTRINEILKEMIALL